MNNRLHNCTNPYQGDAKKVLCVCSAGLLRSPTTANVLYERYGYNTRAAGIDDGHALIILDAVLLAWADEIVCMDNRQALGIRGIADREGILIGEIQVLNISDSFAYMDNKLVALIEENYIKDNSREAS